MPCETFSIFEENAVANGKRIYIGRIQKEIYGIIHEAGGVTAVGHRFGWKLSRVKEWPYRGKSISLSNLVRVLSVLPADRQVFWKSKIEKNGFILSSGRSTHQIQFPRKMSKDLAYIVGLILGDGSLSGDTLNPNGNWRVSVFCDNHQHKKKYSVLMQSLFGIKTKEYYRRGCWDEYFFSSVMHWFFKTYFDIKNGYKADKIEIPKRILKTKNTAIINACLSGLFDSDGTIIVKSKTIKFASTSEKAVQQVNEVLSKQGFTTSTHHWLKNPKYKMLYDVCATGI